MLTQIDTNLDGVAKLYADAEDASRVRIEDVWDDLGYDLPEGGDANLERWGQGDYLASAVMAILDSADWPAISLEYLHSCLTYAIEVVALGFKAIAKVVGFGET